MSRYYLKKIEFVVNENGCHICISHRLNGNGYPTIKRNYRTIIMSRYLWEQKNGSIPEDINVLHKCDTPACINLEHFFLGTLLENSQDMVSKNRQAKGEKNGNNKLTEKQVLLIRQEKGTCREIAKKYGVGHSMVNYIKNRKNWKYLND